MKIKVGKLKKLLCEAAGSEDFTFEVFGPDDETYTVTATYNPMTPFEVEVWHAVDETGQEIDIAELEAQGHDLQAKAMESIPGASDMDPPGTGWDAPY